MTERDIEGRLVALFERQAASLPATERTWEQQSAPRPTPGRRPPRSRLLAIAGVAVVVVVAGALVAVGSRGAGDDGRRPSIPAAPDGPGVRAETNRVSFDAESVVIEAGGRTFRTAEPIAVHGDPGSPEHTTLELEWSENGVEMRLYLYFRSDGREWWSDEIRTYDGTAPERVDWITYTGEFFRTPLGEPFVGDLDITASASGIAGRLRLSDLRLEAFRKPAGCGEAPGPYVLEADTDLVDMVAAPNAGYALNVTVYDTTSCTALPADRFTYRWTADDPGLLRVTPMEERVELQATSPGRTVLRVRVQEAGTGTAAGDAVIEVVATV